MKHTLKLSLLCSAILMAGCGDNTQSSGTENQKLEAYLETSLARSTTQKMALKGANASVPLNNNLLFDSVDGTLKIPTGGDDSISNPRAALNYADGFSTTMPIYISFEGAGFGETAGVVPTGVTLLKLSKKLTDTSTTPLIPTPVATTDYVVYKQGSTLAIAPTVPFDEKSEYLLIITDDVTDVNGDPVGTSQSYAGLKTNTVTYTSGDLASAQSLIKGQEALANAVGVDTTKIVYSSWFTTTSVGDVVEATAGVLASVAPTNALNALWKGSANPNAVDLSDAYSLSFDTSNTTGFLAALQNDANVKKYLSKKGETDAATFIGAVQKVYADGSVNFNEVNVTKGTLKLPHFLETNPTTFATTPFESATPSLAILNHALTDDKTKDNVIAQLVSKSIDPQNLSVTALMGVDLTDPVEGGALDKERIVTQYSPIPKVKSLESVDVLLFTPTTGTPAGVVVYQHGITTVKENAYAFAANLTAQNLAVIAIDHPIHGSRALAGGAISTTNNALYYLNLSALPVARDNIRQSVLDVIGLRMALSLPGNDFSGTPLDGVTLSNDSIKFLGHSLGGITGLTSVATAQKVGAFGFKSAAYPNAGGHIAELLFASKEFGPEIKHNLAKELDANYKTQVADACKANSLSDKDCYNGFVLQQPELAKELESKLVPFKVAAQTLVDTVDPHSMINASGYFDTSDSYPTLLLQVDKDGTVPNNGLADDGLTPLSYTASFVGTQGLGSSLGLTELTEATRATTGSRLFAKFSDVGTHSTFIVPKSDLTDVAQIQAMRSLVSDFLANDGSTSGVASGVLE
ncbi:lipase [Vibrio sinaloensis]|uniref:VolA/Pla-1 family phospholipase n=1 Tax=Photobacterium sp. (strain ATCC 43367) TaxID=379097 RepID=UPI00057CA8B6|nr:VolA/Pla-1 family phospholipase [Vibrio sinaloensis]KIE22548.1 lipase [Vibrio sinaloensis]